MSNLDLKKVLIGAAATGLVALGAYFLYKQFQNKEEELEEEEEETEENEEAEDEKDEENQKEEESNSAVEEGLHWSNIFKFTKQNPSFFLKKWIKPTNFTSFPTPTLFEL